MSADQHQTSLASLQCHFTWNLNHRRSFLLFLWDVLEDIGTEESNKWLGHIYNLRGFIQYKLGFAKEAKSFFSKAAEALKQIRNPEEGPWLLVNYGNLAWLHHDQREAAESQAYLSKVDALMKKYPSPSEDDLHPEIYAEKGWTMMNFKEDKEAVVPLFQKAISMQPDMVEWNTSFVILLAKTQKQSNTWVEPGLLEKMRNAKEQDPENLYLAALYLRNLGKNNSTEIMDRIKNEAGILRGQVLRNPVSSYSGIRPLLLVYRRHIDINDAIDLAEEALKKHPDSRYLKSSVAFCYRWKIMTLSESHLGPNLMERAISLHQEVVSLYPHSSLMKKLDLAFIYGKSDQRQAEAEQIYQELLEMDLDPPDRQKFYNFYAKYICFVQKDSHRSLQHHMKAAEIPVKSHYRENSISYLKKARDRGIMCREIEEFLENLQEPTA